MSHLDTSELFDLHRIDIRPARAESSSYWDLFIEDTHIESFWSFEDAVQAGKTILESLALN